MLTGTMIGMAATFVVIKATDLNVDRNKTRTVIDPCRALCSATDEEGCGLSRTVPGQCEGLFRDQSGNIAHSEDPNPEWTSISAEEARSILSTQAQSCSDICAQLEDCPASYCKQNNHCHGLFWSDVNKREACFYTDEKPCRTKLPVLCDYENHDSTATTPTSTSTASPDAKAFSSIEASGVDAPTSEDTYMVHEHTMVDNSVEREPEQTPLNSEIVDTDVSDDITTHIATPMSEMDARSAQGDVPQTQTPLRANQNETQASKSFEVLRNSAAGFICMFSYIILCVF